MPFNGSEYILSCTVSVDSSVDTGTSIFSQWVDSTGMLVSAPTITNTTERHGDLQQWSNLTFRPLRSEDEGTYICNTTVTPDEMAEFVEQASANTTKSTVVESEYCKF